MPDRDYIEVSVEIAARPATVFRFFTDPQRVRRWFGESAQLDARAGGALRIVQMGGTTAIGEIVEVVPDQRIVFTWGYEGGANGIAPGASRVVVELTPTANGTTVLLRHEGITAAQQHTHTAGWRFYLAQLAAAAARDALDARLDSIVDTYVAAWNETDYARRTELLQQCWDDNGVFKDAMSYVAGRGTLAEHIAISQNYMRGATLTRSGPAESCHDRIRFPWRVVGPDGSPMAQGTNYGDVTIDGKIRVMVGFWDKS